MKNQTQLRDNEVEVVIPPEFKELFNPYWRVILYYGGRGSTKSHSVARSLVLRARQETKRILCARELLNSIDDSSYQLLVDIIQMYGFDDFVVTKTSIINTVTGSEFLFKGLKKGTAQSVKSLEGIDIAWVEESQTVSEESLNILSPTIRKDGSQLIFTFNRIYEKDPVYVKYIDTKTPMERVYHKLVNYDVAIKAGMFPEVLRLEMEHDKANNPEDYAHKWLGQPMSQDDKAIIPRTLAIQSMEQKVESDGAFILGVDVARMGKDRTVLWLRKGLKTIRCEEHTKLRTTEVVDEIKKLLHEIVEEYHPDLSAEEQLALAKEIEIRVDDTGVGGGVTDGLFEDGWNVVPVNFGAKAIDEDKYPNWISEAWFNMKSIIRDIELPFNSDLLMELTSRQWKMDNKGKRRVESKDDYKKRGYRSPDLADAAIICYAREVSDDRIQFLDL